MPGTPTYYVYILASGIGGTLYIGVTNDFARRVGEHKDGLGSAFCAKHSISRLVYYESFFNINDAIAREKKLKCWRRAWKVQVIEERNPNWVDLLPALR